MSDWKHILLFLIVICEHVQLNKMWMSYPCLYLLLLLLYLNCGLVCFGFAYAIIVWLGVSQKLCECRTVPLPEEGNTWFPIDRLPLLLQIRQVRVLMSLRMFPRFRTSAAHDHTLPRFCSFNYSHWVAKAVDMVLLIKLEISPEYVL